MTINPDVIGISSQETLIPYITRVDFAENTGNSFSRSNRKTISKCLGYFNSIYIRKYKQKIVVRLNFSNLPITCSF